MSDGAKDEAARVTQSALERALRWPLDALPLRVTDALVTLRHLEPAGRDALARCLREGIRRAKESQR